MGRLAGVAEEVADPDRRCDALAVSGGGTDVVEVEETEADADLLDTAVALAVCEADSERPQLESMTL